MESKREQQKASSSSGRNESQTPSAQASGDRLQSTVRVDNDMIIMLYPGFVLHPNSTVRVIENLKSFPMNIATRCSFAPDCMWASFQMRH